MVVWARLLINHCSLSKEFYSDVYVKYLDFFYGCSFRNTPLGINCCNAHKDAFVREECK